MGIPFKKHAVTDYFIFVADKEQIGLMVDFTEKRAMVRANTARIEGGIALEPIKEDIHGFAPGMVLMKNGWRNYYFLPERVGWIDADYFEHAERLMMRQGIRQP